MATTPVPSTLVEGSRSQAGSALGYHLVVMGPAVFEVVRLPVRGQVVVGRGDGADVGVDEPRASRRHVRIHLGDEIAIEDLGSANGTRLRGRKLEPRKAVTISAGEAISIGALVLMVQMIVLPSRRDRRVRCWGTSSSKGGSIGSARGRRRRERASRLLGC